MEAIETQVEQGINQEQEQKIKQYLQLNQNESSLGGYSKVIASFYDPIVGDRCYKVKEFDSLIGATNYFIYDNWKLFEMDAITLPVNEDVKGAIIKHRWILKRNIFESKLIDNQKEDEVVAEYKPDNWK